MADPHVIVILYLGNFRGEIGPWILILCSC